MAASVAIELEHSTANMCAALVTMLNGLVSHDLVGFPQKFTVVPIGNITGGRVAMIESYGILFVRAKN